MVSIDLIIIIFLIFCFLETQLALALGIYVYVMKQKERIVTVEVPYDEHGIESGTQEPVEKNEPTNYDVLQRLNGNQVVDLYRNIEL